MPDPDRHYDLLLPAKIVFGWGRRVEVGPLAASLGRRAFLVHGSRTLAAAGHVDQMVASLAAAGVNCPWRINIAHEPEVADVDQVVGHLREFDAGDGDLLIALGGGAAIDLAKAAAAMVKQPAESSVVDYLEGVGRGLKIAHDPLPLLAMPTTGGTGTEATKNAVISSYDPPFKKSLRDEKMIPRVVLIDPQLAASLPPAATAHCGMDAITQLIESYLSRRASAATGPLCLHGVRLALPAIATAVEEGSLREAREAMAEAALLSGIALANSGLGMAHGVAAALGVHCRVPHGLACAVMLPVALRANLPVCGDSLAELAQLVGESSPQAFVAHIESVCHRLGIPRRLSEIGVRPDQLPDIAPSSRGNSMSANPRELSDDELSSILQETL